MEAKCKRLLQKSISVKPNLFTGIYVLQHVSRIFGIHYFKNGWGFNYESVIFTLMLIWFGGCSFGTGFYWIGCNENPSSKNTIIILFGIRLVQVGLFVCIIKFRCCREDMKQIIHLSHRLNEKNADFISFKYHRRNYVMCTLFFLWIASKLAQFNDLRAREKYRVWSTHCQLFKYGCTYMTTWPLSILSWQFLVWMQVFSCSLKISVDELRCAIIKSQEIPCTKHELQIFESVSQVRTILKFKEKILHVYGPTILFGQLRASVWIILNAHWDTYRYNRRRLTFLLSMFTFNVVFSFLPYWVGQEVASEVSLRQ